MIMFVSKKFSVMLILHVCGCFCCCFFSVSRVLWEVLPPLHPKLPPRTVSTQRLSSGRRPTGNLRGLFKVNSFFFHTKWIFLWISNIRNKYIPRVRNVGVLLVWVMFEVKTQFELLFIANLSLHKTTTKQQCTMRVTTSAPEYTIA